MRELNAQPGTRIAIVHPAPDEYLDLEGEVLTSTDPRIDAERPNIARHLREPDSGLTWVQLDKLVNGCRTWKFPLTALQSIEATEQEIQEAVRSILNTRPQEARMSVSIPITGWYLENRIGSHSKFYTVLIAENGVVTTAWGRIGTQGQKRIQRFPKFPDAEALGKRQLYSKQTGGYSLITDDFKFTVDSDLLNTACQRDDASALLRAFAEARLNPQFEGDRDVVLKHYDDFTKKAQRLLETAGDRNFEEVSAEFDELSSAWQAISDKHDEVAVQVNLAEQLLAQRLMSGAL